MESEREALYKMFGKNIDSDLDSSEVYDPEIKPWSSSFDQPTPELETPEMETSHLETFDMSTRKPSGGGLTPGSLSRGRRSSRSSSYVPPNSSQHFEGSGMLKVFEAVLDDENSPFEPKYNRAEGFGSVRRPDGTLYMKETDEGLLFNYTGELFSEDVSSEAKRFQGNTLNLRNVVIDEVEIGETKSNGRILKEGEYGALVSDETPFDYLLTRLGGRDLSASFELTERKDVEEFAEVFGAIKYLEPDED